MLLDSSIKACLHSWGHMHCAACSQSPPFVSCRSPSHFPFSFTPLPLSKPLSFTIVCHILFSFGSVTKLLHSLCNFISQSFFLLLLFSVRLSLNCLFPPSWHPVAPSRYPTGLISSLSSCTFHALLLPSSLLSATTFPLFVPLSQLSSPFHVLSILVFTWAEVDPWIFVSS